jgi:uncharacterized protein (DUF608 family)
MESGPLHRSREGTPYTLPRLFEGRNLDKIAFPVGGLGAGMFAFGGTGAFSHFSVRHLPYYPIEMMTFSAVAIRDGESVTARVLEGPVPAWKFLYPWNMWGGEHSGGANGAAFKDFGLPRFDRARFSARFPFATVTIEDEAVPLEIEATAWSPFIPGDADASGLPAGAVEYRFKNPTSKPLEFVYSFHSRNFLDWKHENSVPAKYDRAKSSVGPTPGGFILRQAREEGQPHAEASVAAWIDDAAARADLAWFRGGWFDALTLVWKNISEAQVIENPAPAEGDSSEGGSIYLPIRLEPGEERTIRLLLAWYAPYSRIRVGHPSHSAGEEKPDPETGFYRPWYSARFNGIESVVSHWTAENGRLRDATASFTNAFYDTTLPPEIIDAITAGLTILKTPTVLREWSGKLWAWEGTGETYGSCYGSCTHVWNYAQAIPHLFPALERGLREIEFNLCQDARGHQNFRTALPLGPTNHDFHAAADGQLGGIVNVYREWRISGDVEWLRRLWPKIRQSLDYCIETWDPDHRGALFEPHHNTYDIEFWGADGMCSSIYLAALQAVIAMANALGDAEIALYEALATAGKAFLESTLFNGEYFTQKIEWDTLRAADPVEASKTGIGMSYSPEAKALLEKEGPKYQYGEGCLADGIIGEWMAWAAGLDPIVDPAKTESHVVAVHRHNFLSDLSRHANPQRCSFAFNHDAGLLLCTWPRGGALTLPFTYSKEVWTGIEYQVAAHLISLGRVVEGLVIVRGCRDRYNGETRNPFDEYECGHWYARAMSSYSLLQALTGARYDATEKKLHLAPRIAGDFRSFLAVDGGYGAVGLRAGKPFFEVLSGKVEVREFVVEPFS